MLFDYLAYYWPQIATILHVVLAAVVSAHVVINKRDPRAAAGWVGLIWLSPFLGAFLYYLLGINRISRRATGLRGDLTAPEHEPQSFVCTEERLEEIVGQDRRHLVELARLGRRVTSRNLLGGNRVEPLLNGDEAFPRMIEEIGRAKESINLCSYIFDYDRIGKQFVEALIAAHQRGVAVRVIVDGVGARYKTPRVTAILREAGIKAAEFLPTLFFSRWARFVNLRNHRKILVIDNARGFAGGMNIREEHALGGEPRHPEADVHFFVEGPVVAHLQEDFAIDWKFCTDEELEGDAWFPDIEPVGQAAARGIPDGPDEDLYKLGRVLLGALACAKYRVVIATPYFLPGQALIAALNVAALRGVEVDILVPRRTNSRLVQWASAAGFWQVLAHGCRVYRSADPFEHTKLMLVDDAWTLFGSANWDPRSLRLNFEFNVECYDCDLARRVAEILDDKLSRATPVTLEEVDGRALPVRIRDGVARLFSPYL